MLSRASGDSTIHSKDAMAKTNRSPWGAVSGCVSGSKCASSAFGLSRTLQPTNTTTAQLMIDSVNLHHYDILAFISTSFAASSALECR